MNTFDEVMEEIGENSNWNDSTKLSLLLDYMQEHYSDKIDHFKAEMLLISTDEMLNSL